MAVDPNLDEDDAGIVMGWEDGTGQNPQFRQPLASEFYLPPCASTGSTAATTSLAAASTTKTAIAPAKAKGG